MMKNFLFISMIFFSIFNINHAKANKEEIDKIYKINFINLVDEQPINLADYKGKVLLIVNTASKCGFTKQYEGLERLHQKYKDRGLIIIGVPSDNFGGQEFADNDKIKNFCKHNFGVSFLMSQKQQVVGDGAHPFFLLVRKKLGSIASPKWNFYKYLINRDGVLVDYFISSTEPENKKLITSIEKLL